MRSNVEGLGAVALGHHSHTAREAQVWAAAVAIYTAMRLGPIAVALLCPRSETLTKYAYGTYPKSRSLMYGTCPSGALATGLRRAVGIHNYIPASLLMCACAAEAGYYEVVNSLWSAELVVQALRAFDVNPYYYAALSVQQIAGAKAGKRNDPVGAWNKLQARPCAWLPHSHMHACMHAAIHDDVHRHV